VIPSEKGWVNNALWTLINLRDLRHKDRRTGLRLKTFDYNYSLKNVNLVLIYAQINPGEK